MQREAEALLLAKLRDGISLSQKRPFFLGFLDEAEAASCETFLKKSRETNWLFWGGYEEAERRILGLFPDYLDSQAEDFPRAELFPLVPLTFLFRESDFLSHRDFLGSFMALGIERDVIGDILVGQGRCIAFIRREMEAYFLQNLRKIGRVGVRMVSGMEGELPYQREFETLPGVVASPRLDCLVAFLCRTSREKAAGLITAGMVMRNHKEVLSVSEQLKEGDSLSVRKHGKFIIDRLGPLTGKGRLSVQCRKYK